MVVTIQYLQSGPDLYAPKVEAPATSNVVLEAAEIG
jgi:hypothetical protein